MTQRNTVVLVHGLWAGAWSLKLIGKWLEKKEFEVHYFKYNSIKSSLNDISENLFHFIKSRKLKNVTLAGHSLGGIVILNLLNQYQLNNIKAAICFGSPVNGSIVVRSLCSKKLFRFVFGNCFNTLSNGLDYTGKVNVGIIAGNGGKGIGRLFAKVEKPHDGAVSITEATLKNSHKMIILPVSHFSMLFSKQIAIEIAQFSKQNSFDLHS